LQPPGGGTLVRLTVPRERAEAHADKITVLLADDHALVRKGFRRSWRMTARSRLSAKQATEMKDALALSCGQTVTVMITLCQGVSGFEGTQSRSKLPEQ